MGCQIGRRASAVMRRDNCSTERWRSCIIELSLLLGGRSEAAPDRLICPPASVSRHARPPQRLGLGEDETASEGQGTFREQKPLNAFVAHEPGTVQEPRRLVGPDRLGSETPPHGQMLADSSQKCVHFGIVGQAGVLGDAPRARSKVRVPVEVIEESRKTEPQLLALTDELQDLYQRARSDQVRFPLFGMHRAGSQSWL